MLLLDLSNTATRCIGAVTFYSVLHYLVADERLMRGTVGYCRLSCRLWTSYMKSFDCTTYRDTALSVFTSQRSKVATIETRPLASSLHNAVRLPRYHASPRSNKVDGAARRNLVPLCADSPRAFVILHRRRRLFHRPRVVPYRPVGDVNV